MNTEIIKALTDLTAAIDRNTYYLTQQKQYNDHHIREAIRIENKQPSMTTSPLRG